jgi:hypothetical protein
MAEQIPTPETQDYEFLQWDTDPKNPYYNESDGQGHYENADEVETAFKAGMQIGYERGVQNGW